MNKQYRELFQMVARNGVINAEKAVEVLQQDKEKDNSKDINSLLTMRDSFNKIEDNLLNNGELELADYVKLYAGATVTRNVMQKNINTWTAIVKEYDDNLIPKLYEVAKTTDDKERNSLIDEYFS